MSGEANERKWNYSPFGGVFFIHFDFLSGL